jgi:catechol 2,3-dioxygenase-like lactoylglutathione lyase family enzyme
MVIFSAGFAMRKDSNFTQAAPANRRHFQHVLVRRKPMLNHVSIGVRNLSRAKEFYDEALKPLGYKRLYDSEDSLGYGADAPVFWVLRVATPVVADAGSGLHFCLDAPTRKSVDAFHKAALGSGGKDNGKPGLRADYGDNYYAAFVVDPDGYRLEAYCPKAS